MACLAALSMPSSPFSELLSNASRGSDEAAWDLTAKYTPHLVRVVRAGIPTAIRGQFDTVDFIQQVWSSLFLSDRPLNDFENERELMGYLASMVRHKVIDAHRAATSKKRDVKRTDPLDTGAQHNENLSPEPHAPPQTGSEVMAAREKWAMIMHGKPESVQKIVTLRMAGSSNEEIASECGVTARTVSRVLKGLREEYLD